MVAFALHLPTVYHTPRRHIVIIMPNLEAPDTNSGGRKLLTLRKGQEPGRDEVRPNLECNYAPVPAFDPYLYFESAGSPLH